MRSSQYLRVVALAAMLVAATSTLAAAQEVELGASLASLSLGTGDNDVNTFGIPSGGFGIIGPAVYVSIFATPNVSVEPQIGLLFGSGGGDSFHVLNLSGQLNYFFNGSSAPSPFVFGSFGVVDTSGGDVTPKSMSVGGGYRKPVGSRLAFRFDGRFLHYTEEGADGVVFTVSIGGIFGHP